MRPENRFDTGVDDLVDTIAFEDLQDLDVAGGGSTGSGTTDPHTDADTPDTTATATPSVEDATVRTKRRARRLNMMAGVQAVAFAAAWASMALPWYQANIPASTVMTASGQLVAIGPATVAASGFDVVANGSTTPFCPAAPVLWSMPMPLAFAAFSVALVALAVLLRSALSAAAGVIAALQAVRHLGVLHASVVGGPAGCMLGQLDTAFGRPLFIVALTVVVTLSALTLAQLWLLRAAEKRAKIAAGEPVPPTLVEMIQGRLVGVAAAVVAEAQRR